MRTVGVLIVSLALLATSVPTSNASPVVPTNAEELNAWLVANGLLDATVAAQLVEIPSETVPSIPMALPGTAGNPKGCSGANGFSGALVTPKGVAGVNCNFAAQTGNAWSLSVACTSVPSGFSSCFGLIENLDFFNFGIVEISCFSPAGSGAGLILFQQGVTVTTLGCTVFAFGSLPSTWATWIGFGGGFGGLGAWDATVLIA